MISLLLSFFSSFITTLVIIRFNHLHSHFTADSNLFGPQKFHAVSTPRIGGLSIAVGIFTASIVKIHPNSIFDLHLLTIIIVIPAFAIGFAEDLTKKIGVKTRLIFTAISAALAAQYLGAQITRFDVPGFDLLLGLPLASFILTVFAITGLANAYNIIDGFNGLSSMVGMISLMGLAYVSFVVGDLYLMQISLMMAAAILGFFLWNYPRGLIFLGDGGAYLIGFWIAIISVLLVAKHSSVSPWFAILINAYPIMETIFTIYRRKIQHGKSPGAPDGIHFHTLIYRRILKPKSFSNKLVWFTANAKTAPYLWILTTMATIPSILWWNSSKILILSVIIFTISYIWLYKRIVCFRTPVWMHFKCP